MIKQMSIICQTIGSPVKKKVASWKGKQRYKTWITNQTLFREANDNQKQPMIQSLRENKEHSLVVEKKTLHVLSTEKRSNH